MQFELPLLTFSIFAMFIMFMTKFTLLIHVTSFQFASKWRISNPSFKSAKLFLQLNG